MLGDGDVEWWEGVRLLHAYTVTPADTHITHSYIHYRDWGEGRLETEFPSLSVTSAGGVGKQETGGVVEPSRHGLDPYYFDTHQASSSFFLFHSFHSLTM